MIVLLEIHRTPEGSGFAPLFRGIVNFFGEAASSFTPLPETSLYWWETVKEDQSLPPGFHEGFLALIGKPVKSIRLLRMVPDFLEPGVDVSSLTSPTFAMVEY